MKREAKRYFVFLLGAVMFIVLLSSGFSLDEVRAADEYDDLRLKWRDVLTGGSSYNPLDTDIAAKITDITSDAQGHWNTMDTSGSRTYIWSDLQYDPTSAKHISDTYAQYNDLTFTPVTTDSLRIYITDGSVNEGTTICRLFEAEVY